MGTLGALALPDKGISVEANGQKNQEVQVGSETHINDNEGTINTSYTQEVPMEFMVLLVLGWLLPSPSEMWRGLVRILPWTRK